MAVILVFIEFYIDIYDFYRWKTFVRHSSGSTLPCIALPDKSRKRGELKHYFYIAAFTFIYLADDQYGWYILNSSGALFIKLISQSMLWTVLFKQYYTIGAILFLLLFCRENFNLCSKWWWMKISQPAAGCWVVWGNMPHLATLLRRKVSGRLPRTITSLQISQEK